MEGATQKRQRTWGMGKVQFEALGKNCLPQFPDLHSVPARGGENACSMHRSRIGGNFHEHDRAGKDQIWLRDSEMQTRPLTSGQCTRVCSLTPWRLL